MRAAERTSIRAALDELGELAGPADREELARFRDRLDATRLRVLVAGEAKRGKSTLVNALLGRGVLPAGVTPLTAVPATVAHAPPADEGIEVFFAGGGTGRFPLSELGVFGTERGNPGNCRQVSAITVRLNAPLLSLGVEIVDTPGTGSVHAHNTAAAAAALPSMDAAIFVLTADPLVSASERDLLRTVAGLSVALFVVLNKADYLDPVSLAEAVEFTGRVVAEATGRQERVYPVSARDALSAGGDAGFAAFAADFESFLAAGRAAGVRLSVTRHVRRICQRLLDEVALAQRAAALPGQEAGAQLAAFARSVEAVASRRIIAEDFATTQSGRLLEALNAAAGETIPALTATIGDRMTRLLDAELATTPAAGLQRDGRGRLTSMVADAVEAWRQQQAGRIEDGLSGIDRKLAGELEADLAAVRSAAADLLGVDLALPSPAGWLVPDAGFFYSLGEHVDQSELLAGAVRRRLPGDYGRRLARQRLLAEVPGLVASQVGRARADLQYRLAEASRGLLADVRRRHADTTGRLGLALQRASRIREAAGEEGERQRAELTTRELALRAVISQLAGSTCATDAYCCDQSD